MSKYYEGKTQNISKISNLKSILYLQDTAYNITECITEYIFHHFSAPIMILILFGRKIYTYSSVL